MSLLSPNIDNTCAITIALLDALKVKVTKTTVVEAVQNHPNFPSLLSISDALKQWKVDNAVVQIAPAQLSELSPPFIAQIKKNGGTFVTVIACNETDILYKEKTDRSVVKMSVADFKAEWSGIVLLAEAEPSSGEENYKINKRIAFLHQLKIPAVAFLLLVFCSVIISRNYFLLQHHFLISLSLFTILKLVGIVITTILLAYEVDGNNPALQKICSIGNRTNCNAILQSKEAKLFNLISWSEIGFFYFSGTFLSLLLASTNNIFSILQLLALLNIIALPYILFSVFYQWRIAKQWCVLCLFVQFLLLGEGLTTFISNLHPFQNLAVAFSFSAIITLLIAFSIPMLFWLIIKPILLKAQALKSIKKNFLQLKFNSEIFNNLLIKEKAVIPTADTLGIVIGNPNATNTIIIVSNPYCGPCADVHAKAEKLLEYYDAKVQIIFRVGTQENDISQSIAAHLLAIAAKGDEALTKKALNIWYLADKKDYEKFAAQYPLHEALEEQTAKLDAMHEWCKEMDILFTPTLFMNGYQLPSIYHIEDIAYFLNE